MSEKEPIVVAPIELVIHELQDDRGNTFYRVVMMCDDDELKIHLTTFQDFTSLENAATGITIMSIPNEMSVLDAEGKDFAEAFGIIDLPHRKKRMELLKRYEDDD